MYMHMYVHMYIHMYMRMNVHMYVHSMYTYIHMNGTNHTKLNMLRVFLFSESVPGKGTGMDRYGCTRSLAYPTLQSTPQSVISK